MPGGWTLLSCFAGLFQCYRWVHAGQHQVPHSPTPAVSYPSSLLISPSCSSSLVDIQPSHCPLPVPLKLLNKWHVLLSVGDVQNQDISYCCPIAAVKPQLFNSHVACCPRRGSYMLSSYPSKSSHMLSPVDTSSLPYWGIHFDYWLMSILKKVIHCVGFLCCGTT